MASRSLEPAIKKELALYLDKLPHSELKATTRKHCRSYLEKKLQSSLKDYKEFIKSTLIQYFSHRLSPNPSHKQHDDRNGYKHREHHDGHRSHKRKLDGSSSESNVHRNVHDPPYPPRKRIKTARGGDEILQQVDVNSDSKQSKLSNATL